MVAYGYGDYRQVPIVRYMTYVHLPSSPADSLQIYMLQYLTPDVMMALLKVQQGVEVNIAGK